MTGTGRTTTDPWDDRQMLGTGDLALFLGGSEDSFTGLLLMLMQKADPGNLARLERAFPREARARAMWNAMSPCPTFRELREALQEQDAELAAENLAAADPDTTR